jgi:hypothetical protein
MMGAMERNVSGLIIYSNGRDKPYLVLDCRVCPFEAWGTLPPSFNIWQNIGQLKIWFLANEAVEGGWR